MIILNSIVYAADIATLQEVWNSMVQKWISPIVIMVIEYLTRWGPGLLRLGAIMSFGGYCVSRPGLLRLRAVVG